MRNTDADWRVIGEAEPYFGVLTDRKFLRSNLDDKTRQEFFATGERDVDALLKTIREKVTPDFRPQHALDFGCGVGRLAFAIAPHALRVTGVDISSGMLAEAARERMARGIAPDNVAFQSELPDAPYDWVNSYLVFQHIPPERGYELLARLLCGLSPRGIATIHMPAYRTLPHLAPNLDDVALMRFDGRTLETVQFVDQPVLGRIRMYDYDMTRVLALFVANSITTIYLQHLDHRGHHAFAIAGRKA